MRASYDGMVRAAAAVVSLLGGLLLGVPAALGSRPTSPPCQLAQLALGRGADVGEPTGQHTVVLVIRNVWVRACVLRGYPVVRFRSGAHWLPFRITHGGDQVVTTASPTAVTVSPHAAAYVVVNKYRCDAGDQGGAIAVAVRVPGNPKALYLSLRLGEADFSYCGAGNPGSLIAVSPFEPTQAAALRKH